MKKFRKSMNNKRRLELSQAAHDRLAVKYKDCLTPIDSVKKRYHIRVLIKQDSENRVLSLSERRSLFNNIEKSFGGKIYY